MQPQSDVRAVLDRAKKYLNVASDADLARKIGVATSIPATWVHRNHISASGLRALEAVGALGRPDCLSEIIDDLEALLVRLRRLQEG